MRARKAAARRADADRGIDRRTVLDAASRLLSEEGPSALTMRRLANEIGASTMVLYARFANREALIGALLGEGFSRFADTLSRVDERDPADNLRELGRAYRRFVRANPTYYNLMWRPAGKANIEPSDTIAPGAPGERAFRSLIIAVTRVLAAQDRSALEAESYAVAIWSTVHGFCALELAGAIPPHLADASYEATLAFVVKGLQLP